MTQRNKNRPQYKYTKVGWIPEEWECVKLKDVGITYSGLNGKNKDDFGKGKPYIPYLNIFQNSKIDPNFLEYVYIKQGENQNKVIKGDVFFTVSSETPDEVGMSSVLLDDIGECYLNSFCIGYRLSVKDIIPEYLRYYFRGITFRHQLHYLAQGATRYNISKTSLLSAFVFVPSLPEQKKIAEILSAWDRAIEQIEKLIEAKERLKKGLMQQLLTGRMRFREFGEPVEKRGELPEGWKVVRLGEIFTQVAEKVGNWKIVPFSISAGIGFVSQTEKWGKEISGKQYPNYTILKRGQFSYNKGNSKKYPCGCAYLWKSNKMIAVPNVFISFEAKSKNVCNEFYEQYFIANMWERELKKYITSSARSDGLLNLSASNFFKVKLPFLPLPEQQKIASALSVCDREIELLKNKLDKFKKQKKGLMQKLLTGEVRVKVS